MRSGSENSRLTTVNGGVEAGELLRSCAALFEQRGALAPLQAEYLGERPFRGDGLIVAFGIVRAACFVHQHGHCDLQLPALVGRHGRSVRLRSGEHALDRSQHDGRYYRTVRLTSRSGACGALQAPGRAPWYRADRELAGIASGSILPVGSPDSQCEDVGTKLVAC
jgi:hypothetical protein